MTNFESDSRSDLATLAAGSNIPVLLQLAGHDINVDVVRPKPRTPSCSETASRCIAMRTRITRYRQTQADRAA